MEFRVSEYPSLLMKPREYGPKMVRMHYYSACLVCMETDNVKKCSKCKLIKYCGKEHQKQDWTKHKHFCKVVFDFCNVPDWHNKFLYNYMCRYKLRHSLKNKLNRDLEMYEEYAIVYNEGCVVCHTNIDLILCSLCKCKSYCKKHYESDYYKHTQYCLELKKCFDFDKFILNCERIPLYYVKPVIDKECTLDDAHKCLVFDREELTYPENFIPHHVLTNTRTVLYTLKKLGMINSDRKFYKDNLILHIMAPIIINSDFIFHWLDNLKSIKYVYLQDTRNEVTVNEALCSKCVRTKSVELKRRVECYNEVHYATPPHLVVVLPDYDNSYLYEDNICAIFECGAPVCLLSNSENSMSQYIKHIDSLGHATYYLVNRKNPFHGKVPMVTMDFMNEEKPYYYRENRMTLFLPQSIYEGC